MLLIDVGLKNKVRQNNVKCKLYSRTRDIWTQNNSGIFKQILHSFNKFSCQNIHCRTISTGMSCKEWRSLSPLMFRFCYLLLIAKSFFLKAKCPRARRTRCVDCDMISVNLKFCLRYKYIQLTVREEKKRKENIDCNSVKSDMF